MAREHKSPLYIVRFGHHAYLVAVFVPRSVIRGWFLVCACVRVCVCWYERGWHSWNGFWVEYSVVTWVGM
jgi:hypothetical protein